MVVRTKCKNCRTTWSIPLRGGYSENSYLFECDCGKGIQIHVKNGEITKISGGKEVNERNSQSAWSV
jgi:hypothetical protein